MYGRQWMSLTTILNSATSNCDNLKLDEAFDKYYKTANSNCHKEWLEETIKESPKKLNCKAETLRNFGNKQYARGNFKESIKWYRKSLHFATFNSSDYGKAFANRSAATFALKKYDECLKDIQACFASKYPHELRSKVLLRRLQAYYYLCMEEEFFEQVNEMKHTFKGNAVFENCVNTFSKDKQKLLQPMLNRSNQETHALDKEPIMSETFASATNLIELKYDVHVGRHVVAAKDIKAGSILFQEKAFVLAQIFHSAEELVAETCYNCLKYIPYFSIPCKSCTYALYCSEHCLSQSWDEGHCFECPGMVIFYQLGCSLIAFKCLMKGIPSGFDAADKTCVKFGGPTANYRWINSLVSNFESRLDKMHLLGVAFITVLYLKTKTEFFRYLRNNSSLKFNVDDVDGEQQEILTGIMLVKHMTQMFCNGSIVGRKLDEVDLPIAAGIYPAISMMNHSCKANVSIEYSGCLATVRATDDILQGCEVFNCYGVNQTTDKATRTQYLRETFGFTCFCPICTKD